MDMKSIIFDFYPSGSRLAEILLDHSRRVRDMALTVADRMQDISPDRDFIAEGAMLHDIGICRVDAPDIGCHGDLPYVCHGIIGREMLEARGMMRHALVCERHVGTGITLADIRGRRLPLPERDMSPRTIEETIICYADKFFSKTNGSEALSLETVLAKLKRYGQAPVDTFMRWHRRFSG